MKKYKVYLLCGVCLILGAIMAWFIKPDPPASPHDHTMPVETASDGESQVWTCSMHPQIRSEEPGLCPICEMDLIPAAQDAGHSDDPTILQMSPAAAKLAQIETYTIGQKDDNANESITILADGQVVLDERTQKSQTAHIRGRIESIQVTYEGQYVKKGQPVATIYSTDLLAASQELLTASKYDSRVDGLQDAAIQKLKNWKISDEQIQDILDKGAPIETITIYADHSGYVLDKKIALGDYLQPGQALYTVGSTGTVWLLFDVFESAAGQVDVGSRVEFTTPSLPNQTFETRITYIDPLLNHQLRSLQVRAEIANPNRALKPGMLIRGRIYSNKSPKNDGDQSAIYVPQSAILWTGKKSVVYVQDTSFDVPSFRFREVTIAQSNGDYTQILAGLNIGDRVVTHGAFAVDAAAQLNNTLSMMNRQVSIKEEESEMGPDFADQTDELFKSQLDTLIYSYVELKDALVLSDVNMASEKATLILDQLDKIDMKLVEGSAHDFWMDQRLAIEAHAEKISQSTQLEQQRNQFDFLSQTIIAVLKAYDPDGSTYFVQYCPMAINNQGADWISLQEEIENPYFGDKMLKCGEVKLKL